MRIVTASNGKKSLKLSKKDWLAIGKKAGWKEAQLSLSKPFNPQTYSYFINLDERGSFYADVRDSSGKTVFEIKAGNELGEDETSIFEDGFMEHEDDLEGLRKYLVHLGIMKEGQKLVRGETG